MPIKVESWDYPVMQEVTRIDPHGFPVIDYNLLTPNCRFVLATIPANCEAMLQSMRDEFIALQWLPPIMIEEGGA